MAVRSIEQEAAKPSVEARGRRVQPRRRAASWTARLYPRDAPLTARQSAGRVAGTVVARP